MVMGVVEPAGKTNVCGVVKLKSEPFYAVEARFNIKSTAVESS
jgi:hypothetical protein